ncbi:MAG: hypothetical protein KOO63_05510 [Bacteroidales bacterium]|nr:hypothetical protein [Candidatus Latescibacterota bacterium]
MGNRLWGNIYNSSNASKHSSSIEGSAVTSDATETTVLTLPVAAGQVVDCEAICMAWGVSGAKIAVYKLSATFKRVSSLAREGYDASLDSHMSAEASYAASLDASGNSIVVTVTGADGETVKWSCRLVYRTLAS